MLRTFAQHRIRTIASLDGWWNFQPGDTRRPPRTYEAQVHVPCAWESIPGFENYRGVAWLGNRVTLDDPANLRVVFGGVSHTADVHLDGKHVGNHYDAFTPFEALIPNVKAGEHSLDVRVDNTFGEHSALHKENDYYTYGGITRPVELQLVPDAYITAIYATPRRRGSKWDLEVSVEVANCSRSSLQRRVMIEVADELVDLGEATIPAGETLAFETTLENMDVEPWTMDEPVLYEILAVLLDDQGEPVDDLIDRVGFREIVVKGKKLLLNGQSIRLRGFNRHEDYGPFGCAVPLQAMMKDLMLLRDMGCNFIRTCHYPNDMRFLDLCDEMGFAVWEENHARAVPMDTPKFDEQIDTNTEEMVLWHYNHPSILMWGILNECDSDKKEHRPQYARILKLIRSLDDTRPLTYASNRHQKDVCYDLADIVSWNRYDAWYADSKGKVGDILKDKLKWLHSPQSKGGAGKPVIMSEFGAGAIPGWRAPHHDRWTEEYQAEALDECLEAYLNHPDVVGAAIWQFCDVRLTKQWWKTRPRNMNNKGVVDEHRRPKLAYDTVKRHMHAAAERWDKKR